MTTQPVEPVDPANVVEPTNAEDPERDPGATPLAKDSDVDSDPDTDAMGINDDDPLDATLVGEPVDADDDNEG